MPEAKHVPTTTGAAGAPAAPLAAASTNVREFSHSRRALLATAASGVAAATVAVPAVAGGTFPTGRKTLRAGTEMTTGGHFDLPAVAAELATGGKLPDPHLAWIAELEALHAADDDPTVSHADEAIEARMRRMVALEELIGRTPSRTLAGAVAQVRGAFILLDLCGSVHLDRDTDALRGALATFDRLDGRAAA